MSNRIFPNWEQLNSLRNPLTEGERCLLEFLDENLPEDEVWKKDDKLVNYRGWLIFAQPFLNGSRPDIIIYNPYVGIVIYEVKDWHLEHYSLKKDESGFNKLHVSDAKGTYKIKEPVKQVEHYKEKIIGQLVPNIGEVVDNNNMNYGLIKTALYFHNIDTKDAQNTFGTRVKDFKYFPVFGNDFLDFSNLNKIVPDVHFSRSKYWNRDWNEEIMFWLNPPFHSIEQGIPLSLRGNQVKIAEPKQGHQRVRGVAGSGKTQALAYRAGKLASQDVDVLIITFNITLWHYIKDMIARSPFKFKWNRITFTHFHGFCKDILNINEIEWPKSKDRKEFKFDEDFEFAQEQFFKSKITDILRDAVHNKKHNKYGAILIDEGQDFHFDWYSVLNDEFLTERDELLVVCDKKQNIYDRELNWIDKRVTREGLDKFGDYIDLTSTFRMPKKVAHMSNKFSEIFGLNQDLKVSNIVDTPVLFNHQKIVWKNIDENKWLDYLYRAFTILKKEEYNPSDMVILVPNHKYGKEAVKFFKDKNIDVNHVFEDDDAMNPHKKSFWMGDSRLKISTIHSFKGWELLNIVLFIPKRAPESNKKLDSIIYTAITRTRENLIVFNANQRYNEFGENYPDKWNEQ
jgi:hypothetical protein